MMNTMRQKLGLIPALAALMVVTGCSSLNPFAAKRLPPAELVKFTPSLNVKVNWTTGVGKSAEGAFAPAVDGNTVYAASEAGTLTALDQASGKQKWSVDLKTKLVAGVAVTANLVAVIDSSRQLVGFDLSGKQLWKTNIGNDVTTKPIGVSGLILVRTIDYSIAAYSSQSGGLVWKYTRQLPPLTLRSEAPLEINNGRVYAGLPGGRLVGLDINTGQVLWEGLLASPTGTTEIERISDVTGAPVYNFREVCGATFQGRVGCLDATTGRPLWSEDFSAPNGASVDDRYLITANELGDMYAFSRNGGKRAWKIENFERRSPTTPVVVGRAVAIGDFEGYLHFIGRDDGRTLARLRIGSTELSSKPVVTDSGLIFVQSRGGDLSALSIQ
jgi:outer membrane protein assembly factor BamB